MWPCVYLSTFDLSEDGWDKQRHSFHTWQAWTVAFSESTTATRMARSATAESASPKSSSKAAFATCRTWIPLQKKEVSILSSNPLDTRSKCLKVSKKKGDSWIPNGTRLHWCIITQRSTCTSRRTSSFLIRNWSATWSPSNRWTSAHSICIHVLIFKRSSSCVLQFVNSLHSDCNQSKLPKQNFACLSRLTPWHTLPNSAILGSGGTPFIDKFSVISDSHWLRMGRVECESWIATPRWKNSANSTSCTFSGTNQRRMTTNASSDRSH